MKNSTLRIAWRNLGRNRKRTLLALSAIALAQLTLVAVNGMMAGMYDDMLRILTGPLLGHVQVHHKDWREERAVDLFMDGLRAARSALEAMPAVEAVSPRIYAAVLAAPGTQSDQPSDAKPAMIVGLDVQVESRKGGILESLPPEHRPQHDEVVLGKVLAHRLGVRPGQQIAIIGQDADEFPVSELVAVKAIVRGNTDIVNRLGVLMALPQAQTLLALENKAHEILVYGKDYRRAGQLAEQIAALPAFGGTEVLSWRQAAPEFGNILDMKNWFDLIFVGIVFVAAAAGIANTMMMSTFERTREFGMLLAVGSRPARLVRMVVLESVILGLIGVLVGSLLGSAVVLITARTGIDYAALAGTDIEEMSFQGLNISYVLYSKFEFRNILFGVVAVTLTSVLASLWPALISARLEPVEAMRT
ncbi:MAG: ABC transporter permease [Kiritimatiellae bacterium]|nr:ABC transporter permease [Kiritimatiellia bacterium]